MDKYNEDGENVHEGSNILKYWQHPVLHCTSHHVYYRCLGPNGNTIDQYAHYSAYMYVAGGYVVHWILDSLGICIVTIINLWRETHAISCYCMHAHRHVGVCRTWLIFQSPCCIWTVEYVTWAYVISASITGKYVPCTGTKLRVYQQYLESIMLSIKKLYQMK